MIEFVDQRVTLNNDKYHPSMLNVIFISPKLDKIKFSSSIKILIDWLPLSKYSAASLPASIWSNQIFAWRICSRSLTYCFRHCSQMIKIASADIYRKSLSKSNGRTHCIIDSKKERWFSLSNQRKRIFTENLLIILYNPFIKLWS